MSRENSEKMNAAKAEAAGTSDGKVPARKRTEPTVETAATEPETKSKRGLFGWNKKSESAG